MLFKHVYIVVHSILKEEKYAVAVNSGYPTIPIQRHHSITGIGIP